MKKDFDKIFAKLNEMQSELNELKKLSVAQAEEIAGLRKQLSAVTTVKIEEDGKQSVESFGNLILDEILSLQKKLEGFSAEGLRGVVNDVAALKNKLEGEISSNAEFSLSEIKDELLKLADMLSL